MPTNYVTDTAWTGPPADHERAELYKLCGRGPFLAAAAERVIAADPAHYGAVRIAGAWREFGGDAKQLRLAIEADTGQKAGRGPRTLGKLIRPPSNPDGRRSGPVRASTARDAALRWIDYREHVVTLTENATDPDTYGAAEAELERATKHLRAAAGKRHQAEADAFLAQLARGVAEAERVSPVRPGRAPVAYEYVDRAVYERSAAEHAVLEAEWSEARERVRCAFRTALVEPGDALAEYVQRTATAVVEAEAARAEAALELRAAEAALEDAEARLEAAPPAAEIRDRAARKLRGAIKHASAYVATRSEIQAQRETALERARRIAARAEADAEAFAAGRGFLRGDAAAEANAAARAAGAEAEAAEAAQAEAEAAEAAQAEAEAAEAARAEAEAAPAAPVAPAPAPTRCAGGCGAVVEAGACATCLATAAYMGRRPMRAAASAIARAALASAPIVIPAVLAGLARHRRTRRYVEAGLVAAEAAANEPARS